MKALFSSWLGEVVDNRGEPPESWAECPSVKLPDTFGADKPMSAFIGWGGVVILNESYDIVEMAYKYAQALQASSCAKCFPCRVGTKVMEDTIFKILEGNGSEDDLATLETLCDSVSSNSKCGIGQLGPGPIKDTLDHFKDDYRAYISGAKKRPDYYYPYKMTAPCTSACPTGMDIPLYIEQIKEENFAGSLKTIREASPMASSLGRACFHPCENNCRRDNVETSLAICKLKRFAWDYEDIHEVDKPLNPNKHTREESVAIIGSGIAGCATAYYLALMGYRPVVFEKLSKPGGVQRTGIPQYRIPLDSLDAEIKYLERMGVEFVCNVSFGKDETFKTLRQKGFKAIVLATGADLSKSMRTKGEDQGYEGYFGGIEILKKIKHEKADIPKYKTVLTVGGGNTAMDCCRTFARLGADSYIVYRRTEKELPCDPHEYAESLDEGVKYMFLEAPSEIVAENGKVVGLKSVKMELGEPDDSGRRRPVPIEGSDHIIKADCIISAIGQDPDIFYMEGEPGIEMNKWDNPVIDEDTMQVKGAPDVFAAGDSAMGPETLVIATGHGKRAAQSIDQYIRGEEIHLTEDQLMENIIRRIGAYDKDEKVPNPQGWERQPMPICDHDKKTGSFEEVELGYSQEQAMEEAARCMRCYIVGMACVTSNNGSSA